MEEIAQLLREQIGEVRDIKNEVVALGGPTGRNFSNLSTNMKVLVDVITGLLNYSLQDVMERMHGIHLEIIEKN
jgi:hypothetical protein